MRVDEVMLRAEIAQDKLVRISARASQFVSDIFLEITKEGFEHAADAKSLLGLLVIPHTPGTRIRITTKGRDEEEALEAMIEMYADYL